MTTGILQFEVVIDDGYRYTFHGNMDSNNPGQLLPSGFNGLGVKRTNINGTTGAPAPPIIFDELSLHTGPLSSSEISSLANHSLVPTSADPNWLAYYTFNGGSLANTLTSTSTRPGNFNVIISGTGYTYQASGGYNNGGALGASVGNQSDSTTNKYTRTVLASTSSSISNGLCVSLWMKIPSTSSYTNSGTPSIIIVDQSGNTAIEILLGNWSTSGDPLKPIATIYGTPIGINIGFSVVPADNNPHFVSINIKPISPYSLPIINGTPNAIGVIGTPFSYQVDAVNAVNQIYYEAGYNVNRSLPPGLSIDQYTGLITGTPTTTGVYPFDIKVYDAFSQIEIPTNIAYSSTVFTIYESNDSIEEDNLVSSLGGVEVGGTSSIREDKNSVSSLGRVEVGGISSIREDKNIVQGMGLVYASNPLIENNNFIASLGDVSISGIGGNTESDNRVLATGQITTNLTIPFGGDIPPRRYTYIGWESLTRKAFFTRLCRILARIGMQHHEFASPGVMPNGRLVSEDGNVYTTYGGHSWGSIEVFTFPSNQTFDVKLNFTGVSYVLPCKPVLFVVMGTSGSTTTSTVTDNNNTNIYLDIGYVYAGIVGPYNNLNQFSILNMQHANQLTPIVAANSINYITTYDANLYTTFSANKSGARIFVSNWQPGDDYLPGSRTAKLILKSWDVSLGPGGLHIQCGTGDTNDNTKYNVMNCLFAFCGERFRSRAKSPNTAASQYDINRRTFFPVTAFFLKETTYSPVSLYYHHADSIADPTQSTYSAYYSSYERQETVTLTVSAFSRVNSGRYVDNESTRLPDSLSPKIIDNVGRNIMTRLVFRPFAGTETGSGGRRPADAAWWDNSSFTSLRQNWSDFFTSDYLRISDIVTPIGTNLIDPNSGKTWRPIPWEGPSGAGRLLLNVTGETVYTTIPSSWNYGVETTYTYNISTLGAAPNSAPGPTGNPPVLGTPFGTSANGLPSNLYSTITIAGTVAQSWSHTTGNDYLEARINNIAGSNSTTLTLYFDLPVGTDTRYVFSLEMDASLTGGTENSATQSLYVQATLPLGRPTVNANYSSDSRYWRIAPAGSNSGNSSFLFTSRGIVIPYPITNGYGRFCITIILATSTTPSTQLIARVGNFRIRAKRLLTDPQ